MAVKDHVGAREIRLSESGFDDWERFGRDVQQFQVKNVFACALVCCRIDKISSILFLRQQKYSVLQFVATCAGRALGYN
jgi:hypothetical protein